MNEKIKSPSGQGGAGTSSVLAATSATAASSANSGSVSGSGNSTAGGTSGPATSSAGGIAVLPNANNGSDTMAQMPSHAYGPAVPGDPVMSHYHMHQQQPHSQHITPHQPQAAPGVAPPPTGEHPGKEGIEYGQSPLVGPPQPMPALHPMYGRYHHTDPNMDPYRYGHSPLQQPPPGGKPQQSAPGVSSPSRPPPQRYVPGQPPQGPTPTLNSLLQSSHPPPPQHRYSNNYDPQQPPPQQQQPPQQVQAASQPGAGGPQPPGGQTQSSQPVPPPNQHGGPPPPPHQSPYSGQQSGWAPPPRPYSPQLGPSQQYRTPPPTNSSRGQSPYPPSQVQNSGSYPSSPQQPQPGQQQQQQQQQQNTSGSGGGSGGGPPPPPQSSNQGTTPSQYSPYPQRYPTPPGPATGPNHRAAYSTHQYPEPNRPWPGGSSPVPSPGPGGHPLPPASPHHNQHSGPPPSSSPSHAPSPSPQPSQASPSPHQELIGQNSNDSSSGGGHSGLGSGPPGTPNPQLVMRPTPSPTGSSGSRSMSPAVAQNHTISRPSSNQSSSGSMQQPGGGPPGPQSQQASQQQQSQQTLGVPNSSPSASNSPQQQQGPPSSSAGVPPGSQQQQPSPTNQNVNNLPSQPLAPQGPGAGLGGYPLPPHMHGSYKIGGQSPGPQGMLSGYAPQPPQQAQQYSQGSYPQRPQYPPGGYAPTPPPSSQASGVNSMPPGGGPQQYSAGRPMPNHSGPGQYPSYQNWVPSSPQQSVPGGPPPGAPGPASIGNHVQNKGTPPPPQGSSSPRPLNYLKQHLQHKGGYPGGPPQGYGNGPGMHPGMPMGPPHHMGPPHGPTTMGPPPSTPPQSMMVGTAGEGSNSGSGGPPPPDHISQDNGLSSSSSSSAPGGPPHPVTSVVTTGPDGASMDEASQQSTISNASAASAEDPQCTTPKSRKSDPYGQSHLAPPSTSPVGMAPGPHPGHPAEDFEMSSPPNWARTPASPGFNSHIPPQDTFRTTATPISSVISVSAKKSDSLCKLYEMDDNADRRIWLDKLRAFMDERRTPITTCPTISKQPLDLYRLYLYVKERGGFVEVCKVTKSKTWKDIAGLLGIGASSSAAYTLRKHYTKNLFAYECHFDRGDVDPLPIIQQVEAGTKKKSTKAASVPSPAGSSNSQDSFPAPSGAANTSMDGYPQYPGTYPGGPGPQPDYGATGQIPRPPSQNNAQGPHPGTNNTKTATAPGGGAGGNDNISVNNPFDDPVGSGSVAPVSNATGDSVTTVTPSPTGLLQPHPPHPTNIRPPYPPGGPYPPPVSRTPGSPYPGQPGAYGQYSSGDQYNTTGPPGQFGQQQGQFPPQNRNMYPPYGPEGEAPPSGSNQYGPYGNRPYSQPPPGGSQTSTAPGAAAAAGGSPQGVPPVPGSSPYPPPGAPGQQEYYRPADQATQPRRHPDFVKDAQPYPGYNARPQIYGGWQSGSNQYRTQYPSTPSPQAWGGAPPRTSAPSTGPLGPPGQQQPPTVGATQWDQHRYQPQQQQQPPSSQPQQPQQQQLPYQQQQQGQQQPGPPQWAHISGTGSGAPPSGTPGSPLRPPSAGQQQQQRMPSSGPSGAMNMGAGPSSGQQICPSGAPPNTSNSGAGNNTQMPQGSMVKPPFSMPPPPQSGGAAVVPAAPGNSQGHPGSGIISPSVMGTPQKPMGASNIVSSSVTTQPQQPQQPPQTFAPPAAQHIKKEIIFPPDSVEATTPVLYKRKRLSKADVCPVDPWRLFMAMRSGLLTECTWAFDVLNVLLFDDSTVQFFGLSHLPGLLTLLLEHFQRNLAEMFNDEENNGKQLTNSVKTAKKLATKRSSAHSNVRKRAYDNIKQEELSKQARLHDNTSSSDYEKENDQIVIESDDLEHDDSAEDEDIDLGQVKFLPNPDERVILLAHTPNYTMMSRKGLPVRLHPADHDIFITDGLKSWDSEYFGNYEEKAPVGSNAWTYGLTDLDVNAGIIDVFKSEFVDIPFANYIRGSHHNGKIKTKDSTKLMKVEDEEPAESNKSNTLLSKHTHKKSEIETTVADQDEDEVEARLQQNTFNKKRRLFNNSVLNVGFNSNSSESAGDAQILEPSEPKKIKAEGQEKTSAEINRQDDIEVPTTAAPSDSDCREVDMELETIITKYTAFSKQFDPKTTIRDPALVLQRRHSLCSLEDECYTRDESSLYLVNESEDSLARRCICISNIFRNLSFVPGNETILAKSTRFLAILGRLLLLNHEHLPRTHKNRNYERGTEEEMDFSDSCSSLQGEREWWWEYLISIRENMLVIMANIAGHLDLSRYEELIARPLIDGLLHWAVCPSAHGQDPFPSCSVASSLSPQRLALEALCKLCVTDNNVDLVIATPPHSRLEKLCAVLTRHLCRNEDQVLREFSVNLLHYLAAADSAMARTVALQSPCISYLVAFIEQAEQTALGVANQQGINYLRENPDSMGTSLDMLRRAAGTLLHLAKHPDNRSLFMQQEQRLLGLVMSHILDQQVALVISRVLFQVSRGSGTSTNSLEYRLQQKHLQQKMLETANEKKMQGLIIASSTIANKDFNKSNLLLKMESVKPETYQITSMSSNVAANNASGTENSSGIPSAEALASKPSSTVMSADENSNSSSQITPSATFNDVSNSSTNSNSCGTAASSHSNLSQNSVNSSIGGCSNNSSSNAAGGVHNLHATSSSGMAAASATVPAEHLKTNILSSNNNSSLATSSSTTSGITCTSSSNSSSCNSLQLNNSTSTTSCLSNQQQQQQIQAPPPPPATSAAPSQAPSANNPTTAAVA